jgi:hypothetical protein
MPEAENTSSVAVTSTDGHSTQKPEIDLQALAERIFRLIKEDARVQQERQSAGHLYLRKDSHGH